MTQNGTDPYALDISSASFVQACGGHGDHTNGPRREAGGRCVRAGERRFLARHQARTGPNRLEAEPRPRATGNDR